MTHSSPGMCIDRRTNPHSFASPSYSRWTSPSAPGDQTSVSRLRRARSLFQISDCRFSTRRSMHCKLPNTPNVTKHITASFQTRAVLARARGDADYGVRVVSHHSNSDRISPSLSLISPSNFHKMLTFKRVTNTCHCLVMMTPTYNVSHFSSTTSFIPNLSQSRPACFSAPSITVTHPPPHPRHR